jgi:hypothetical protein
MKIGGVGKGLINKLITGRLVAGAGFEPATFGL